MGRKLDLSHFTDDEIESILKTLNGDFRLRKNEFLRLRKYDKKMEEENIKTTILSKEKKFVDDFCIRCCRAFDVFFNRKRVCVACNRRVCKHCSCYRTPKQLVMCYVCLHEEEMEKQRMAWFYSCVNEKFSRYGSAKVAKAIHRRNDIKNMREAGDVTQKPVRLSHKMQAATAAPRSPDECPNQLSPTNLRQNSHSSSLSSIPDDVSCVVHKDAEDMYKDAFSNSKQREEDKFKARLETVLGDLYRALDNQAPACGMPTNFATSHYTEIRTKYKRRIKDLLQLSGENFQIVHENYKQSNGTVSGMNQKIKSLLTKMVEDRVGEALDLFSDEAVSDLSSSTDDGWSEFNNSFEEHLAQAVLCKAFEKHKLDLEERERQRLENEDNIDNGIFNDIKNGFDYDAQFDKLVKFSQRLAPPRRIIEPDDGRLSPIAETPMKDDSKMMNLPNWNDQPDLGFTEIDPDLIIVSPEDYFFSSSRTSDNWLLGSKEKSPRLKNVPCKKFVNDHIVIPKSVNLSVPRVGSLDMDQLSDSTEMEDESEIPDYLNDSMALAREVDQSNGYYSIDTDVPQYTDDNYVIPSSVRIPTIKLTDTDSNEITYDQIDASKSGNRYTDNNIADRTRDNLINHNCNNNANDHSNNVDTSQRVGHENAPNIRIASKTKRLPSDVDSGLDIKKVEKTIESVKTELLSSQRFQEMAIPSKNADPVFDVSPESVCVPLGETAKVTCVVSGSKHTDVFWYRAVDDAIEDIEESEKYEITQEADAHWLSIYSVDQSDCCQYMCMAISEVGRCCQYFTLKTKPNPMPFKAPDFMKLLEDREVTEGQSVKFRCKVKGYPQSRMIWYKDGHMISKNDDMYRIERFGNRDYILAIDYATPDHDAEYTAIATNVAGQAQSYAQLIVNDVSSTGPKSPGTIRTVIPESSPERKIPASVDRQKQANHLINLGHKMALTRENVSEIAENMLSTAGELTKFQKDLDDMDQALSNMEEELVTSHDDAAVTSRDDAAVTSRDDARVTSNDVTATLHDVNTPVMLTMDGATDVNNDKDVIPPRGNIRKVTRSAPDPFKRVDDVNRCEKLRRNIRDSWTYTYYVDSVKLLQNDNYLSRSEVVIPTKDNFVKAHVGTTGSSKNASNCDITRRPSLDRITKIQVQKSTLKADQRNSISSDDKSKSVKCSRAISQTGVTLAPNRKEFTDSSGEPQKENDAVNFGLKPIPDKHKRDYFTPESDNKPKKWDVKLSSFSPNAEIANKKPSHKELRQEMSAAAPRNSFSPSRNDTDHSVINLRPAHMHIIGQSREEDIPSTDAEFNADTCPELPSVDKLKKMFSKGTGSENKGDSSFQRVRSITARQFTKAQLDSFKTDDSSQSPCSQNDRDTTHRSKASKTPTDSTNTDTLNNYSPVTPNGRQSSEKFRSGAAVIPSNSSSLRTKSKSMQDMTTFSSQADTIPNTDVQRSAMHKSTTNLATNVQSDETSRHRRDIGAKEGHNEPQKLTIKAGSIQARAAYWNKRLEIGYVEEAYPSLLE